MRAGQAVRTRAFVGEAAGRHVGSSVWGGNGWKAAQTVMRREVGQAAGVGPRLVGDDAVSKCGEAVAKKRGFVNAQWRSGRLGWSLGDFWAKCQAVRAQWVGILGGRAGRSGERVRRRGGRVGWKGGRKVQPLVLNFSNALWLANHQAQVVLLSAVNGDEPHYELTGLPCVSVGPPEG